MRPKFNAVNCIMQLNQVRIELSTNSISEKDFREFLKICGIPSNSMFWNEFRKSNLIEKDENGNYSWVNPSKPIHYKELEKIYNGYKHTFDRYYGNYQKKKAKKEEEIYKAINLLKEHGFIVLQQEDNTYVKL